jgi:hypothetical protein
MEHEGERMTDDTIYELLVAMEMKYQRLGANLVDFLDLGFDPDTYYTPCENAMYCVYEHLGYDRHDIAREAYRRLTEEAEE